MGRKRKKMKLKIHYLITSILCGTILQVQAKNKTDKYPQDLVNIYVSTVDQLGDLCASKSKVFQETEHVEKALNLALWLWNKAPSEKNNLAISINCFSEANPVIFQNQLNKVPEQDAQEIKNEIEKAKKLKKDGNA